jgi:hypothetical protein
VIAGCTACDLDCITLGGAARPDGRRRGLTVCQDSPGGTGASSSIVL